MVNLYTFSKHNLEGGKITVELSSDGLQSLKSKACSWDTIEKYFRENPWIKLYYEDARDEAWRDNCQSAPAILIKTVEKLLSELNVI